MPSSLPGSSLRSIVERIVNADHSGDKRLEGPRPGESGSHSPASQIVEWVKLAESLGYELAWMAEGDGSNRRSVRKN
jgi:alkanesulfonate monooxygenase SsuD/methylene tetrahydromethanopterin reductase-like flavin-dependent oxidoreductase (luciferase family)